MQAYRDQGIQFSSDYFTEETIAALFQPDQPLQVAQLAAEPSLQAAFSGVTDPISAFQAAWTQALQDPKFKAEAQARGEAGRLAALEDFERRLTAELPAGFDAETADRMKTEVTLQVTDDAYVHHVDGVQVLCIPKAVPGALAASKEALVCLQILFVVIDAIFLVVAAMGVSVALRKNAIAAELKGFWGPLKGWWTGAAKEMERLEKEGKKLESVVKIVKEVGSIKGFSIKTVLLAILEGMSWWDTALAIVQIIATVGLLIATAGGEVVKQIAQLGLALVVFATDLTRLIELAIAPQEAAGTA